MLELHSCLVSSSRVAPLSFSRFAVIKVLARVLFTSLTQLQPVMGRQLLSAQGEGTRSLRKIDCQGRLCNTANIASNSDLVNSSTVRGSGESCWRGCTRAIIDNNVTGGQRFASCSQALSKPVKQEDELLLVCLQFLDNRL